MAYECPVCDVLAPDGEHLAHHLAIVALTRGGDHEDWLDAHAEGWSASEPAELSGVATDHADEVEHDLVDDHGAESDHEHGRPDVPGSDPVPRGGPGAGAGESPLDDETAAILREARELTARLEGGDADAGAEGSGAAADESAVASADEPEDETDTDGADGDESDAATHVDEPDAHETDTDE